MKRYVKSTSNVIKVSVVFNVELYTEEDRNQLAAATYKGVEVPEGDLPPADKKIIMNSQVYSDYISFIKSVEDLLTDYYDLTIYYKNESEYDSFYWGGLAKSDDGTFMLDFEVTLRVATHPAHRTKESQKEKKIQKQELAKVAGKKRVKTIRIDLVVNDESEDFNSYIEAFAALDEKVERAVKVMTRKRL